MQYKVYTLTADAGKGLEYTPKTTQVLDPGIWDQSEPMTPINKLPFRPLDMEVTECPHPDAVVFTEHRHDGTYLFTLEAASVVSEAAEKHVKEAGGKWRCSKVHIAHEYGEGPHSCHEMVTIALQRLPESENDKL